MCPGRTGLHSLPDLLLALIFAQCDLRAQLSLAHSSHMFRTLWKELELPDYDTACNEWGMHQLQCAVGQMQSRMRFEAVPRHCKGSTLLGTDFIICASLLGHFTEELLQFDIDEAQDEVSTSAMWSCMERVCQECSVEVASNVMAWLFTFKLHHSRQAGFMSRELDALGCFSQHLPSNFSIWVETQARSWPGYTMICPPVWQLVAPDGTAINLWWDVTDRAFVRLVTDIAALDTR